PNGVTLVVLMGLGRSVTIACRLIDGGWRRSTPAAVIVDATRPDQQVWRGTLDDLAEDAVPGDGSGAGTIVVGRVGAVGLQEALRSPERLASQQIKEREAFSRASGGTHVGR